MVVWRKSSHSGSHEAMDCVEVAALAGRGPVVGVRDSKDPDGPKLYLTQRGWGALLRELKG
jgi:hypothetical protein